MRLKTQPPPAAPLVARDLRDRAQELRAIAAQLLARSTELTEIAEHLEGRVS